MAPYRNETFRRSSCGLAAVFQMAAKAAQMTRRPYTEEEAKARDLDVWREYPEMAIANIHATLKALTDAVAELQLIALKATQ